MEWIIIIAFGLLHVIFLIWNILTNNKVDRLFSAFLLIASTIIVFAALWSYESANTPTAMDVYQGKTTLEYKVVDDVKVDSVVVFKNDATGLKIY